MNTTTCKVTVQCPDGKTLTGTCDRAALARGDTYYLLVTLDGNQEPTIVHASRVTPLR